MSIFKAPEKGVTDAESSHKLWQNRAKKAGFLKIAFGFLSTAPTNQAVHISCASIVYTVRAKQTSCIILAKPFVPCGKHQFFLGTTHSNHGKATPGKGMAWSLGFLKITCPHIT